MASSVIVIDQAARRHVIKTVPSTPLSDVLQQACSKIGVDASQYGLKHGDKTVDLSRNIRMSGLSAGAKLTLVQASKSPSVVHIALQLPPTSDSSGSLARLTDKFPSNTPLWQVLRRFESGAAGGSTTATGSFNFTQRATPMVSGQAASGSGRLCYEMPVLHVLGRELASFADLQKTLAQIGLNSGNALIRLSYRGSDKPLEEAMAEISQYFAEVEEGPKAAATVPPAATVNQAAPVSQPDAAATQDTPTTQAAPDLEAADVDMGDDSITSTGAKSVLTGEYAQITPDNDAASKQNDGVAFFRPPSSSVPAAVAATAKHDESEYIPTIIHAQQHQARLQKESRNRRLKSDKELEEDAAQRAAALAEVKTVLVRFRFPDQSQAQRPFEAKSTTADLYAMCREVMDLGGGRDSIRLRGPSSKAAGTVELSDGRQRLIADLGWKARVLVTVSWGDSVSADARKKPSLKEQYRRQAEDLKVEIIAASEEPEDKSVIQSGAAASAAKGKEKKQMSAEERESRLHKLMGKLGGRR